VAQDDQPDKDRLRREFLRARLGLGAERETLGTRAQSALIAHETFRAAGTVMVYLPFRGEVPTALVIETCLKTGKAVAAPLTLKGERRLVPLILKGRPGELRTGAYGILEPEPALCRAIAPSDIDLVVVPGVAFDEYGSRLGYGGGYYDRFLRDEAAGAVRAALAFEVQISADPLPRDTHDVRMDFVFTEERILRGERR